jgi:hypothetical protein
MIRDSSPIHNVGFGVTSRDFSSGKGQEEGPSPDSGFVSRALHGHPVAKMVASMVAFGIAAELSGKFVREGGLKLRKQVNDSCV